MATSNITSLVKASKPVRPMIYSYTTPQIAAHQGWSKIGYTEKSVDERIKEQVRTAQVKAKKQWQGRAEFDDGEEPTTFKDYDLHAYLEKLGIERAVDEESGKNTEWFHIDGPTSKKHYQDFRENRGLIATDEPSTYILRDEQVKATKQALSYAHSHEHAEFLWNAKPRFGKTLSSYDLIKQLGAKQVLIVTNRPAIANSWYSDYVKFLGTQSGYYFVSEVSSLKGAKHVISREDFSHLVANAPKNNCPRCIEFVSLQDLKGAIAFGGNYSKLDHIAELAWDALIIDEAHEGVDTYKTNVTFDHIKRKFTLHLSGTPFKALASGKFENDAIFNWTYADEQQAKTNWDKKNPELLNPYEDLPKLNLFTYQMSDVIADKLSQGITINDETEEFAFDLNEFFSVNDSGRFKHDAEVDQFLNALTTQEKYPFSTPELRDELKHTFWLIGGNPRPSDSAKALAKKLENHPVFKDYKVVLAVGDGKLNEDDEAKEAFDRVREAINDYERTITLSVGQLTTGVTIPEWTAVLMLSNMKSASLYMQAAFRAQNPCLFEAGSGEFLRKQNAYVFDFDPARTLDLYEKFANDLYSDTAGGRGDLDAHKQRVKILLNFFPVIGEDNEGKMLELDAEKILSIPRKIRSQEVVRRGFLSNFLFQNISSVFRAPEAVRNILDKFEAYKEVKPIDIDENTADELELDEQGEVHSDEAGIIGLSQDLFGQKIFDGIGENLDKAIEELDALPHEKSANDDLLAQLHKRFAEDISKPLVEHAKTHYGPEITPSAAKQLKRIIEANVGIDINRKIGDYKIARNKIASEQEKAEKRATTKEERAQIVLEYSSRKEAALDTLKQGLLEVKDSAPKEAGVAVVRTIETSKKEAEKKTIEEGIRDHLRGFSRTIPSFLMAYGDSSTTLANFDSIVPNEVFQEVTSITLDEFRLLRDGGGIEDSVTGETQEFAGHLFDEVVFDDSVHEFIRLRSKLANYFDPNQTQNIFDYIPSQKTNQIFTPRKVVKQMVDLFEQENPGCFDDPSHTFADLYMKSGLFITEIVERLYNSEEMKKRCPDKQERLKHIFEHQVFGAAPTQILFDITTHFILGYEGEVAGGFDTNFVLADTAELAKEGKLADWVQDTFGEKLD